MRFETKVMAAVVMVPAVLTQTLALCPAIILGGPPNIRVLPAVAPIAASSPLSSAGQP
jgi:hypothetical protein